MIKVESPHILENKRFRTALIQGIRTYARDDAVDFMLCDLVVSTLP